MPSIRAVVRNGRIETDEPLDLPDGTESHIPLPSGTADAEAGWDDSPEGIAAWLAWLDAIGAMKGGGAADAAAWLKRCDEYAAGKMKRDVNELFP